MPACCDPTVLREAVFPWGPRPPRSAPSQLGICTPDLVLEGALLVSIQWNAESLRSIVRALWTDFPNDDEYGFSAPVARLSTLGSTHL